MQIEYLAWLSTRGAKRRVRGGALFAGLVENLPEKYWALIDVDENRLYCVITG